MTAPMIAGCLAVAVSIRMLLIESDKNSVQMARLAEHLEAELLVKHKHVVLDVQWEALVCKRNLNTSCVDRCGACSVVSMAPPTATDDPCTLDARLGLAHGRLAGSTPLLVDVAKISAWRSARCPLRWLKRTNPLTSLANERAKVAAALTVAAQCRRGCSCWLHRGVDAPPPIRRRNQSGSNWIWPIAKGHEEIAVQDGSS